MDRWEVSVSTTKFYVYNGEQTNVGRYRGVKCSLFLGLGNRTINSGRRSFDARLKGFNWKCGTKSGEMECKISIEGIKEFEFCSSMEPFLSREVKLTRGEGTYKVVAKVHSLSY